MTSDKYFSLLKSNIIKCQKKFTVSLLCALSCVGGRNTGAKSTVIVTAFIDRLMPQCFYLLNAIIKYTDNYIEEPTLESHTPPPAWIAAGEYEYKLIHLLPNT